MLIMMLILMLIVTIFTASSWARVSLTSNMFQSETKMSKPQLIEIMKFELKVASV